MKLAIIIMCLLALAQSIKHSNYAHRDMALVWIMAAAFWLVLFYKQPRKW